MEGDVRSSTSEISDSSETSRAVANGTLKRKKTPSTPGTPKLESELKSKSKAN